MNWSPGKWGPAYSTYRAAVHGALLVLGLVGATGCSAILGEDQHDRLGYPTDVFADFEENVADEELGFRISNLRPL